MRRALYIALSIVGIVLVLAVGFVAVLQTGFARERLRHLIADMTAGSASQVQLAAIDGFVPFDMRLTGLRLSDRGGIWATADRVDVVWSPLDLLAGQLQVDRLAAGTIKLARMPAAEEEQEPEPAGPLLPELPVAIDLRSLSVERLALGAPILGEPAALSLQASARLGEVGEGLSASLKMQQRAGSTGTAAVDLAYDPDADFLRLTGLVDEPRGGILVRLLGLPRGSALRVALAGEGPLSAWNGELDAKLNGRPLLSLTAAVRGGEARAITVTLQAAPDVLVPEDVRPVIAGGIDARGELTVNPGGETIEVSQFSATTAAGEVEASGVLGLTEPGDLAVVITLADSRPFARLVPEVAWSGATLRGRLQGTIDRPHVAADLVVQDFAAADVRARTGTLALNASAEQGLEQPIEVRADLQLSDLAAADPRLAALLAGGVRMSVAGSVDRAGTLVADRLEVRGSALALSGTARAEQWGAAARQAEATLTIADIGAVGAPFGFHGSGAAELMLTLAPAPDGERLAVNGTTRDLSTGQSILDRLLGQSPRLHLALTGSVPREMTITTAQLIGAAMRFGARGTISQQDLDIGFSAKIDDAAAVDPMLQGEVALDGTVEGTMQEPAIAAELVSSALAVADRRFEGLKLTATAADVLSSPRIELKGSATLDRLPTTVAANVVVEGERISASDLVLTLGQSRLTGDVALAGGLLAGQGDLSAPDLSEVGRLADLAMSGELSATLALDSKGGRQGVSLSATGREIAVAESVAAAALRLEATADDLFGTPVVTADLDLVQPAIADQSFTEASVTATGPLAALQTRISLSGTDVTAAAAAEIVQIEAGYRISLETLTADMRDVQIEMEQPAVIEVGANATRIEDVVLRVEDGSLRLNGSVAPGDLELDAAIRSLPLSIARAFAPDLPIVGTIDGEVHVSGDPAAPSGRFTMTGTGIGASNVPEQQASLQIAGTLQQGRLNVNGEVEPARGGALAFTAALPSLTPDAALQAEAKGTLDLLLVDAFLAGSADRVRGKAEIDISAAGRLSAPEVQGRVRLVDAAYDNLRYGIKLRRIQADLRADGPAIEIASLSATTPGGGEVSGEGEVNLARGIDVALRIQARNATILNTDLATATVDSDLTIAGNLQSRLELGGSVKVEKADIRVPDDLPPSVQQIEVVEVNAPPQLAARIAAREESPPQTVIMALDLAVDAPQQVFVRGRGLDVELGGTIHVGGTSGKPEIDGALTLRRGSLDIAGRHLEFTEGQLTFEGGDEINPILDLTAVTRTQELEVTAKVEGPARAPRITLSSVPPMPEDEILARLLFGKSAGALSAFELLQLAQATAHLAGIGTGPGVLENIRRSTGLDRLSLEQTDPTAGPSLTAGRYVAEGVYVGVSQGAKAGSSAATVEIEVTPNIKVESQVGATAGSKVGVNLEWDY